MHLPSLRPMGAEDIVTLALGVVQLSLVVATILIVVREFIKGMRAIRRGARR